MREGRRAPRGFGARIGRRQNGSMANALPGKSRIVIVGGGPGGYEAALSGAQLGADVTLVERQGIGGSAVLTDVVPSKTLIATAEAATNIRVSGALGIRFGERAYKQPRISVDLGAVNARLLGLARAQSDDMRAELDKAGVRLVEAEGRLEGASRVVARVPEGRRKRVVGEFDADIVIVSTGATPRRLPSARPDGERILTWTQLYALQELPEHLIVIGSGVTGAEFASAYRALGAEVTLVSSRDRVLPGEDQDAARVLEGVFRRGGLTVLSRSRGDSVVRTGDGVLVTLSDGRTVEGSHCLVAVGSIPNTAGIGLERAGVDLAPSGHIRVNRVAHTTAHGVYAAGDCTDFLPLASVASMQGRTAVFHALGDVALPTELRNVTSNIFTQPQIATVGWQEVDVKEGRVKGRVVKVPLSANPRAKMQGIKDGFVKLITTTTTGQVLGGVVVAPNASELILSISLAVEHRLTTDQLASAFGVYPSLSSSITEVARAAHIVR